MPKKRIDLIKKEYELLIPFIKEPWKKYTFRDILKITGKSSESYVYDGLKRYVKEDILEDEKVGNNILYSILLKNPKTRIYAGFVSEQIAWNVSYLPYDIVKKVMSKIPTGYFTFIITGSYALGRYTEKSDVDIVIICDDTQDTKYILAQIRQICELSIPRGHPYIFRRKEFIEMLLNNEANYGKEIVKNNLVMYGGQQYMDVINEAMQHGFKFISGKGAE